MTEEDPELAALRKKRLQEIQGDQVAQQQLEEQQRQIEAQRQVILKGILTNEARERVSRLKLAKPEFVVNLENQLITLAQTRRITGKITDDQLKQLLKQMTDTKREGKITFKRR
jgi:programmed cell death protein 5